MERKTSLVELKVDEKGVGTAVLATLNVPDRDSDVVLPGAFGRQQGIPVLASHEWTEPPLGKSEIYETDTEVRADFKLNLALGRARSWYEAARFDLAHPPARLQYSWGFTIPEGGASVGEFQGKRVRFLRRVVAHEISFVLLGSSVGTRTLALKGDLQDQAALVASVQETLRRGAEWLAKMEGQISYRYIALEGFDLLDPRRHLAREALFFAAKELGIPPPALKFFTSTDPERADFVSERMWGYSRKGDHIAIEWALSPDELVQVVAHECAHAAGLDEAEAEVFGKAFAARHAKMLAAPRHGGGFTWEQLIAVAQAVRSGFVPITR